MKRWLIILCVMIFSVGCSNTDITENETGRTTQRIKKDKQAIEEEQEKAEIARKTCEVCGYYGHDVANHLGEKRMCPECIDKKEKAREEARIKAEQAEKERKEQERKQKEKEEREKEELKRIKQQEEEERNKTLAEDQWNNANDKQLIYSDDMFKIYAYDKHFNGSKFEFRMRLESNSDEPYSFGIASRKKQAYTPGGGLLSSSSYYTPIVYLNGIRYEGYIDMSQHETGQYANYFIKGHTYIRCTIESYDHFNIKSLNNIEFDIISEPVNTPPDLGEDNTKELNINFNI